MIMRALLFGLQYKLMYDIFTIDLLYHGPMAYMLVVWRHI